MQWKSKQVEAREDFSLLMAVAFIFSTVLSVLGFLFLDPLCRFLGSDEALLYYCREYMIPVLLLPRIFGMDGVWLSLATGEMLSLAMSIYFFVKYRNMWQVRE